MPTAQLLSSLRQIGYEEVDKYWELISPPARSKEAQPNPPQREPGGFVQGALVGLGAVGLIEVPLLVQMQAPVEAYPVIGSITVAALGAAGADGGTENRVTSCISEDVGEPRSGGSDPSCD